MFWFILLSGVLITAAYYRARLLTTTVALGAALLAYLVFGDSAPGFLVLALIYAGVLVPLNVPALRQEWFSRPLLELWQRQPPQADGLPAATAAPSSRGWEADLASGDPDWSAFAALPGASLSAEEEAFLAGPVEQLCRDLDAAVLAEDEGLTDALWGLLREHGLYGLTIPQRYGGRGFGFPAVSAVLKKLASAPAGLEAAASVATANLGLPPLLLAQGSEAQRNQWLPALARGELLSCVALTAPDARFLCASIDDHGRVAQGLWRGKETLGLRLFFERPQVPLAPAADLVAVGLRLRDPDGLLDGAMAGQGPAVVLIPAGTPGLELGARHRLAGTGLRSGPVRGRDVFVPLDYVLGSATQPADSAELHRLAQALDKGLQRTALIAGAGARLALGSAAVLQVRALQTGTEPAPADLATLGGMAGRAYAAEALRAFSLAQLQLQAGRAAAATGPRLAQLAASQAALRIRIATERLLGGRLQALGPHNWAAGFVQGLPIVLAPQELQDEESSALLRSELLGAHPYWPALHAALRDADPGQALLRFDAAFWPLLGHALSCAARALVLGASFGRLAPVVAQDPARRPMQCLSRYSAAYATLAEALAFTQHAGKPGLDMHGARLLRVLAAMLAASAVLKKYEDDGRPPEDFHFVRWVCEDSWRRIEDEADGLLRQLRPRPLAWLLRLLVFPLGRWAGGPDDMLGQAIGAMLQRPEVAALRGVFTGDAQRGTGLLRHILRRLPEDEDVLRRVLEAWRNGVLQAPTAFERIGEALGRGLLSQDEAERLHSLHKQIQQALDIDEFEPAAVRTTPLRTG